MSVAHPTVFHEWQQKKTVWKNTEVDTGCFFFNIVNMIYFEGKYLLSKYTFWTKFSPGLSLVLDSFETLKKTLSLFRKWCPVIYWVQCELKPLLGSWRRSWCLPSQGHGSTSVPSQRTPQSTWQLCKKQQGSSGIALKYFLFRVLSLCPIERETRRLVGSVGGWLARHAAATAALGLLSSSCP